MIVRILGEGQYAVPDTAVDELNELDNQVEAAMEGDDEQAFRVALDALLARIRAIGSPADLGAFEPSGLIVPGNGATMAEVRKLLTDDGLIPG